MLKILGYYTPTEGPQTYYQSLSSTMVKWLTLQLSVFHIALTNLPSYMRVVGFNEVTGIDSLVRDKQDKMTE